MGSEHTPEPVEIKLVVCEERVSCVHNQLD
jgi:hypothetical protein